MDAREPDREIPLRVAQGWDDYLALGNQVQDTPLFRLVTSPDAPLIHDANYASRVRASSEDEIEAVLAQVEIEFAGLTHRRFVLDPLTPESFEARLVLEGYELNSELELLLEDELRAKPEPVAIRLVESETDWNVVLELTKLDIDESTAREGQKPYGIDVVQQLFERRRAKTPDVLTWLACADGVDCAYFSSWPGNNGIGKVEDLFTLPAFRHRGIATALIAHTVADARTRGADSVAIGARIDDSPRHMYAALGFRACFVQRAYLKRLKSA
ncbi:MAG: GNAT family N-acetyltransferase [bacterium]|nr:GNAT family N-acetyltransferase [bacterium]